MRFITWAINQMMRLNDKRYNNQIQYEKDMSQCSPS